MSLCDIVTSALRQRFPGRPFVVGPERDQIATFAAAHPDFGDLIVFDHGDEVTVFVGRITHTHFGPVKDLSLTEEVAEVIVEPLLDFLEDLFADRLLVWYVPRRSGGYQPLTGKLPRIPKDARAFVWSGPWTNAPG